MRMTREIVYEPSSVEVVDGGSGEGVVGGGLSGETLFKSVQKVHQLLALDDNARRFGEGRTREDE